MPTNKRTPALQDAYDRGFILSISELQSRGYCKNISAVEEYLKLPLTTLQKVLKGYRSVPRIHRPLLQRFLVDRYDINPKIFGTQMVQVFQHDPPEIDPSAEKFDQSPSHLLTVGDLQLIKTLQAENEMLKAQVASLKSQLENKGNADLLARLADIEKKLAGKTDTKTDKEPDTKTDN